MLYFSLRETQIQKDFGKQVREVFSIRTLSWKKNLRFPSQVSNQQLCEIRARIWELERKFGVVDSEKIIFLQKGISLGFLQIGTCHQKTNVTGNSHPNALYIGLVWSVRGLDSDQSRGFRIHNSRGDVFYRARRRNLAKNSQVVCFWKANAEFQVGAEFCLKWAAKLCF